MYYFARGWMFSGFLRLYAGQSDLAVEHLEISLRLSPRDRRALRLTGIGIALFFNHRFDEALAKPEQAGKGRELSGLGIIAKLPAEILDAPSRRVAGLCDQRLSVECAERHYTRSIRCRPKVTTSWERG
jgi:hypothetical protein